MGVPKFFRWLSERYPLINQPIHCPPNEETKRAHGYPLSSNGGGGTGEEQYYGKRNTECVNPSKCQYLFSSYSALNILCVFYFIICVRSLPHIMPEFDRLYLDMNGIIHCSSHNNAEEEVFDNDVDKMLMRAISAPEDLGQVRGDIGHVDVFC